MTTRRQEMTVLYQTEQEANDAFTRLRQAHISMPPMWPIRDIRVERRLSGKATDPDRYRWVVAGDYSQWP